jgi:hypothetical protein
VVVVVVVVGGGDQTNDGLRADERLAAPVLGDERKETVLDAIPLAGAPAADDRP